MNKKKFFTIIIFTVVILLIAIGVLFLLKNNTKTINDTISLKELPKPEITGGARGEFGIDKNINEETIDEYLNRPDSVYRDMRMLEDPGNYEAIGGDRFLSGYIDGFEVIPLPYIIPVKGLPSEVGDTYTGTTLFYDDNGTYIANFEESMSIIEKIFPKDKVIFLMCGGGGYAGMTKNFLVSLGWNADKIYNIGGYWYYKGEHRINIKNDVDGVISYDFDHVPYHNIEFDKLTKTADYKEPSLAVTEIKISTSKIEIEEGATFKLNAIVLPNGATNKEVKWRSTDETIAIVSDDGLVKAIGAGKVTITVESIDGDKNASCEVTVNKKIISTHLKIDNLSKEIQEFSSYDLNKINKEFYDTVENPDGTMKDEYSIITEDGGRKANDLWRAEYQKTQEKIAEAQAKRLEIFNGLIDNKKSFIVVIEDTDCESTYNVSESTTKILKQNGYQYFIVSTPTGAGNGDEAFHSSKLDRSDYRGGAIAIIKEGKLYASTDPDVDALKSGGDIINWLSKYIDI